MKNKITQQKTTSSHHTIYKLPLNSVQKFNHLRQQAGTVPFSKPDSSISASPPNLPNQNYKLYQTTTSNNDFPIMLSQGGNEQILINRSYTPTVSSHPVAPNKFSFSQAYSPNSSQLFMNLAQQDYMQNIDANNSKTDANIRGVGGVIEVDQYGRQIVKLQEEKSRNKIDHCRTISPTFSNNMHVMQIDQKVKVNQNEQIQSFFYPSHRSIKEETMQEEKPFPVDIKHPFYDSNNFNVNSSNTGAIQNTSNQHYNTVHQITTKEQVQFLNSGNFIGTLGAAHLNISNNNKEEHFYSNTCIQDNVIKHRRQKAKVMENDQDIITAPQDYYINQSIVRSNSADNLKKNIIEFDDQPSGYFNEQNSKFQQQQLKGQQQNENSLIQKQDDDIDQNMILLRRDMTPPPSNHPRSFIGGGGLFDLIDDPQVQRHKISTGDKRIICDWDDLSEENNSSSFGKRKKISYPTRAKSAAKKLSFKKEVVLKDIQQEQVKTSDRIKSSQKQTAGGGKFTFLQPKPPPVISQKQLSLQKINQSRSPTSKISISRMGNKRLFFGDDSKASFHSNQELLSVEKSNNLKHIHQISNNITSASPLNALKQDNYKILKQNPTSILRESRQLLQEIGKSVRTPTPKISRNTNMKNINKSYEKQQYFRPQEALGADLQFKSNIIPAPLYHHHPFSNGGGGLSLKNTTNKSKAITSRNLLPPSYSQKHSPPQIEVSRTFIGTQCPPQMSPMNKIQKQYLQGMNQQRSPGINKFKPKKNILQSSSSSNNIIKNENSNSRIMQQMSRDQQFLPRSSTLPSTNNTNSPPKIRHPPIKSYKQFSLSQQDEFQSIPINYSQNRTILPSTTTSKLVEEKKTKIELNFQSQLNVKSASILRTDNNQYESQKATMILPKMKQSNKQLQQQQQQQQQQYKTQYFENVKKKMVVNPGSIKLQKHLRQNVNS